jgi:hypothetical protein
MYLSLEDDIYIAVIGDIKKSKSINYRQEVQERLKKLLEEINTQYKDEIASKFTVTLGDEFQGLMKNGTHLMEILFFIEQGMFPVKIRFGIGLGKITTAINPEISIGADGPCYHRARSAVNELKEQEKKKQTFAGDVRLEVDEENRGIQELANRIIQLMTAIKSFWSDRQREIIWDTLKFQDSQIETGERMNIKQPTVQRSLSSGKYYAYKEAYDTLGKIFREVRGE